MTTPKVSEFAGSAGRGFAVNVSFDVVLQVLVAVQSLLVPRLVGPGDMGLYALAIAGVAIGQSFKELGVHQKLVQDRDTDLPLAYSVAFTLEIAMATSLFLVVAAIAPLMAALYDRPELTPLVIVLGFTIYTNAFANLPSALYLRRLAYARRNLVIAAGPLANFAVTVTLAFLGYGVWSLVAGALAALAVSSAVMAWGAPMRPRLRLDGPVVRSYLQFGWPLLLTGLLGLAGTWGGAIVVSSTIGIPALGFFSVGQSLARQAFRLDAVLGETVFPALCEARDDLLGQRRAFIATNRITAIWACTLGFGLAIHAPDLVHLILGEAWEPAIFLFRLQGFALAIASLGFSWDVFYRARGETLPTLVFGIASAAWVFLVMLPGVALWGLDGAAWSILILGVLALTVRQLFISRIFPGLNLVTSAWRELAAVSTAAAAAAALRAMWGAPSGFIDLAVATGAFLLLVGAFVLVIDRPFLTDLVRRVLHTPAAGAVPEASEALQDIALGASRFPPLFRSIEAVAGEGAGLPSAGAGAATIPVPGLFPLYLTPSGTHLWVTCRDSSQLACLDTADGSWRTWQLPAWPHVAGVAGDGTVWVGLTLAGRVASVSPSGGVRVQRLARSREILVAAGTATGGLVVDGGNKRLWRVGPDKPVWSPLPDEMVRPDFVAVQADGTAWITDTEMPLLAVVRSQPEPTTLVTIPDGSRVVSIDEGGGCLWVGHTRRPALTRLSLARPDREQRTYPLPGVPFGICLAPDGRVNAALADDDAIATLDPATGGVDLEPLPPGSHPTSVGWVGERRYAACAGRNVIQVRGDNP